MELNMVKYLLNKADRHMCSQIADRFRPTWCIDRPKPMYEVVPFSPWGYTYSDAPAISNYILNRMEKDMGVDIRWYRQHPEHYKESLFREWLMGEQNIFNADFTRNGEALCKMCSELTDLPAETFADYINLYAIDLAYDVVEILFKALLKYDAEYHEDEDADEYDEDDDEDTDEDEEEYEDDEEDEDDDMEDDGFDVADMEGLTEEDIENF